MAEPKTTHTDTLPSGAEIETLPELKRGAGEVSKGREEVKIPNAGEALEPLKIWLKSHYKLRFRERQRIEAFVAYYAGTQAEPMPFAGRTEWLQRLDQWLAQDQSRFLLLSGSAGRGKSALLLHWLARIIPQQPDLAILFLPISIRFETSNELEGLRLLLAAVCDYFSSYGLRFSYHKLNTHDYRNELFSRWKDMANESNQRYLLVIDGIDESTHHGSLKKVLPTDLPANLHLLLSARHPPEETDGKSWFQKLRINGKSWFQKLRVSGEFLELPLLTQSAIAEAIIQLGRPLNELAEQETVVKELYRLTDQGDPLLLTLWIGQIWQNRETAPNLTVDKLQQLKPSFAGFYKIWLEEQQQLWKAQAIEISPPYFNLLMAVLASAYGPLLEPELIALLKQMPSLIVWEEVTLRKILTTANRLVVRDGENQGFSLIHPRLNDYFQAELAQNPAQQRQVHEAYLNWGAQVVADLNQGRLIPERCPHYLLHHYTEHLVVAHLEPRLALEKHWLPLIEGSGWHQAWEAYEDTLSGFLSDLQQVIQVLRQYHQACDEHGERTAMKLAAEVRCALIRASIHTLIQYLPTTLLVQLVEAKIWSLPRAERVIAQFEDREQVDYLVELAKIVLPEDKNRLLQQAITAAGNIQDEECRTKILITLSSLLAGKPHLLQQTLTITENIQTAAGNIHSEGYRAKVLITLSSLLAGKPHLLQQALTIAENIQYEGIRVRALTALAPQLAVEPHLLQQALTAAGGIQDDEDRAQVLIALASQLVGKPRQQILQQALTTLTITGNIQHKKYRARDRAQDRAQALILLVSQLVGKPRRQALRQALIAVGNVQDERSRAKILTVLVSQFAGKPPRRVLKQALIAAENVQDERSRAETLAALVPQLAGKPRQRILKQTLIAAENVQDERSRAEALAALVPQLAGEPRQQVLQQALTAVENIRYKRVQDKRDRANVLAILAPQLAGETVLLEQALSVSRKIQDEWERAQVLTKLASRLFGKLRQQVLQQALIAVRNIPEEESCAKALDAKIFLEITLVALLDREEPTISSAVLIQNHPDLLTYSLWADWLGRAPLKRSELFEVTEKLCAAAIQLTGNPQEANEIARAVMDVVRWWP
ncbi:hypothetical protein THII_2745 [Thioploca ingrica]|uniref:Nephrocystin 3-like N-terminal domain-containing protein n=1 Tax=Thioploca ingrica TaxID=40754 RepID=A0A090AM91_9GAMM|nr:hypothetical protein THII_2745 [Thioploca ingrica]